MTSIGTEQAPGGPIESEPLLQHCLPLASHCSEPSNVRSNDGFCDFPLLSPYGVCCPSFSKPHPHTGVRSYPFPVSELSFPAFAIPLIGGDWGITLTYSKKKGSQPGDCLRPDSENAAICRAFMDLV
jgi:hypothetical protein